MVDTGNWPAKGGMRFTGSRLLVTAADVGCGELPDRDGRLGVVMRGATLRCCRALGEPGVRRLRGGNWELAGGWEGEDGLEGITRGLQASCWRAGVEEHGTSIRRGTRATARARDE